MEVTGRLTIRIRPLRLIVRNVGVFVHGYRQVDPYAEPTEERKAAADPPGVARVDELVGAPLEPAELGVGALHLHAPAREALHVDGRPRTAVGVVAVREEGEEHDPACERAERISAVRLAKRWAG